MRDMEARLRRGAAYRRGERRVVDGDGDERTPRRSGREMEMKQGMMGEVVGDMVEVAERMRRAMRAGVGGWRRLCFEMINSCARDTVRIRGGEAGRRCGIKREAHVDACGQDPQLCYRNASPLAVSI